MRVVFSFSGYFRLIGLVVLLTASASVYSQGTAGRVFIINAPYNNLDSFRIFVNSAKELAPYGKVLVNVSSLADKSFHEIPSKGSSWHEYASSNPTPYKFFPSKEIAPFIPADFVQKNRTLLLEKVRLLRSAGLEASFMGYEPNFLPDDFFAAHPQLMGPRVDHPRRSTQKAFAPCVHQAKTREMYAGMMEELLKKAPEIQAFTFKTNDAGAGMCWAEYLYNGPNGPSACRRSGIGETMRLLLSAYQDGARRLGRKLAIYVDESNSNFLPHEKADIQSKLPADCYFMSTEDRPVLTISGSLSGTYPVKGILNPVSLLNRIAEISKTPNQAIFIQLRAAYDRGVEPLAVSSFIMELLVEKLKATDRSVNGKSWLQGKAADWVGVESAPALVTALEALNETFQYKEISFPQVHSLYWGTTERLINRPLVIAPNRLTKKEEAYFLPFVFNTSLEEARMDYADVHGGRVTVNRTHVEKFLQRVKQTAQLLESIPGNGSNQQFFRQLGTSLRMYGSIMRSCGNFSAVQEIRDRNATALKGPFPEPDKRSTMTGHPDYIPLFNSLRDELDNTQELIDLLKNGGLAWLVKSADQKYEDAFLLGPDLLQQLQLKRSIMLNHWQDAQDYLLSPFK
ncbi:hypothetical protein [Flavihumibacter sp. UBA7668]|uniref:hypothetical protein n=1 Tax=Flavihumibacter sp. UBA7668 TaxID=1946542 RepID=UPI0025BE3538|nr:hypothetical protein [Flavihumibacter sp. UBA7668]